MAVFSLALLYDLMAALAADRFCYSVLVVAFWLWDQVDH